MSNVTTHFDAQGRKVYIVDGIVTLYDEDSAKELTETGVYSRLPLTNSNAAPVSVDWIEAGHGNLEKFPWEV